MKTNVTLKLDADLLREARVVAEDEAREERLTRPRGRRQGSNRAKARAG